LKKIHPSLSIIMFARIASVLVLALPLLVAAEGDIPASQCNTSDLQCCNQVQNADTPFVAGLLELLGITASGVTGQVGITCSPISIIGIGSNSCTQQPVCCNNNNFNGVVALGCTPINI